MDNQASSDSNRRLSLSNVISTAMGIIGIGLAIYFYQASKLERVPVFYLDPVPVTIIDSGRIGEAPVQVLRSDGRKVTGDVTALRFYFWNAGRAPMKAEHVLRPLKLFVDSGATILDYRLLRPSRDETGLQLRRDPSSTHSLFLDFTILEQEDGLAGQVIFEGPRNTTLDIAGTIEGVKTIARSPKPRPLFRWWRLLLIGFAGVTVSNIVMFFITRLFRWTCFRFRILRPILTFLLIFGFGLLLVYWLLPLYDQVPVVPSSIVPSS